MNIHVNSSFDVSTYLRESVARRKRLMNPPPRQPAKVIEPVPAPIAAAKSLVVTYRDQHEKDAHVHSWIAWKIEQKSPCKTYIRRRAGDLGYSYEQIVSIKRAHALALARQLIMWEIRTIVKPGISFPELGRLFGGRDHTTCLYAIRKITEMKAKGAI